MRREEGVRDGADAALTASTQLRAADPTLADLLESAMRDHVTPGTANSYRSAVRRFTYSLRGGSGGWTRLPSQGSLGRRVGPLHGHECVGTVAPGLPVGAQVRAGCKGIGLDPPW